MIAGIKIKEVILLLLVVEVFVGCNTPMTYERAKEKVDSYGVQYWNYQKGKIEDTHIKLMLKNNGLPPIIANLNEKVRSQSVEAALSEAMSWSDNNDLAYKLIWLRYEILSENADGRYAYAYAYVLSQVSDRTGTYMDEAVLFFLLGRLSVTIDGARCQDKGSYQVVLRQLENDLRMNKVEIYVKNLPKEKLNNIKLQIAAIEKMRRAREPQEWLCKSGALSMANALKDKANVKVLVEDTKKPNVVKMEVDTSAVKPEFIDHNQWVDIKNKIIDDTIRSAIDEESKAPMNVQGSKK